MILDIDLRKFSSKTSIDYDHQYYRALKEVLQEYCDYIIGIEKLNLKCKETTKDNCAKIINCIEKYYNADIVEAQNNIFLILKKYINSKFIVSQLDRNYAFRGMAPDELHESYVNPDTEIYNEMMKAELYFFKARLTNNYLKREDMLHIPFDKRSIISTQRYSIPGVPCLYLASTSYGAWRELGKPEESNFNVAAYKIPKDLIILNLCQEPLFISGSASMMKTDEDVKKVEEFIEIFPLVMATSFTVAEKDRKFKSEYMVSQLVMQVVKRCEIDGVAYLSKRVRDSFAYPCAVNLAILMPMDMKNNEKYWKRSGEIELTQPVKFSRFLDEKKSKEKLIRDQCKAYVNKIYFEHVQAKIDMFGDMVPYIETKFAKFDECLVRQTFQAFNKE